MHAITITDTRYAAFLELRGRELIGVDFNADARQGDRVQFVFDMGTPENAISLRQEFYKDRASAPVFDALKCFQKIQKLVRECLRNNDPSRKETEKQYFERVFADKGD